MSKMYLKKLPVIDVDEAGNQTSSYVWKNKNKYCIYYFFQNW